jgi:hypothetical protein
MKGGLFVRVLLVLIFLALVANLVVTAVRGESFLTPETVKVASYWALFIANLCIAGAGVYFTTQSYSKHEKSTVAWGRRGFVVNFVLALVFSLAPWYFYRVPDEISRADAMLEVTQILLLFGISQGTFAFYCDYLRSSMGRPGRQSRHLAATERGSREE